MSDTVKGALIIGICLMLGLWGAGWLSKSDVGRYQRIKTLNFDTVTGTFSHPRFLEDEDGEH